jgi:hypothetical protein
MKQKFDMNMWKKKFESRASYIAYTMKGLDLISFSMPKLCSSLLNKNAVPVLAILRGSHEFLLGLDANLFWTRRPLHGLGGPCHVQSVS